MAQSSSTYRQADDSIDYTPAAAVTGASIVVVNGIPLLATKDIAADKKGSLTRDGVWSIPKVTGAISVLTPVYWDDDADPVSGTAGSGAATATSGGNKLIGLAAAAALSGDYTVDVIPMPGLQVASRIPVNTVAAAGSAQDDAASLVEGFNLVTGADDAKGVKLPTAVAGMRVIVKVGDGADLKVYPATGAAINGLSANAAMTVVDDVCFELIALSATQWYTLPLLPS